MSTYDRVAKPLQKRSIRQVWAAFLENTPDDIVRAKYFEQYGERPRRIFVEKGLKYAGPVPDTWPDSR